MEVSHQSCSRGWRTCGTNLVSVTVVGRSLADRHDVFSILTVRISDHDQHPHFPGASLRKRSSDFVCECFIKIVYKHGAPAS